MSIDDRDKTGWIWQPITVRPEATVDSSIFRYIVYIPRKMLFVDAEANKPSQKAMA